MKKHQLIYELMCGGGAKFHSTTLSEGDPQRHLATLVSTLKNTLETFFNISMQKATSLFDPEK